MRRLSFESAAPRGLVWVLVLGVAASLLLSGQWTPGPAQATVDGVDYGMRVGGVPGGAGATCNSSGGPTKCSFKAGSTFTVATDLNSAGAVTGMVAGGQVQWDVTAPLVIVDRPGTAEVVGGADCGLQGENTANLPLSYAATCVDLTPPSTYGASPFGLYQIDVQCTASGLGTVTIVHGAPLNSYLTDTGVNNHVDKGVDVLNINCVPSSPRVKIVVEDAADPGKKLSGTCFLISYEQASPPANVPFDVVSDNYAKQACDQALGGPLSDSNGSVGNVEIVISGVLFAQVGARWHVQQVQSNPKYDIDNTKYLCDFTALQPAKCDILVTNNRLAGNITVNINSASGLPVDGVQCVDVYDDPPENTVLNAGSPFCEAAPDSEVIEPITLPNGLYGVVFDKSTLPLGMIVTTPNEVECDLNASQACKVDYEVASGTPHNLKLPPLQNLFLTAQGEKLGPETCAQSTDVAEFSYELSNLPRTPDPKEWLGNGFDDDQDTLVDEVEFQELGAFALSVHFDPKLVCVNVEPGQRALDTGMVCLIDDKDDGLQPQRQSRIGCLTKKSHDPPASDSLELARILVRPQPEAYKLLRAHKNNGMIVHLTNQGCNLVDMKGHPIPAVGCPDADLTIRWLEGDIDGTCGVDVQDQQIVAFRWGVKLGHLLYHQRFDLEPSGVVNSDGDVDIKDVQFVFGRHGSTCDDPNPAQPPKNPNVSDPGP